MFRFESYITPILLNYVAKYVKNIRPEDAQLSLWEGEVTFHNLELNLDVLQEELSLPVEFLSGHIHDLSILVPWTKITSEPVRITINTIEFVLKLKDKKTASCGSSAGSSPQRQHEAQRNNRPEEQVPAQAYTGQGLVNKIINNIVINCHNIILKYVEEDIVISMNVQLLSLQAANNKWQPAMVDMHPQKVLMRKLITISDLTICLDKRNEAGRIDVSQEPILYRCTLEIRILRKYDKSTSNKTSTTRVGIFTKMMDINVSSLQFPMAMRLFEILQTLKANDCPVSVEESVEELQDEAIAADAAAQGSVLTWAWNMLPSFNFETYEDEHGEIAPVGHIFEFGLYMEDFNFTLKHSEFVIDSIMAGAKRIRYSPIVCVHFSGIYFEFVRLNEQQWTNLKGGISTISVEPMGGFRADDKIGRALVESPAVKDVNSFKDKSLFDENHLVADQTLWNATNIKTYRERVTDDYLAYRTPVLAFDMVEYISLLSDNTEILHSDSMSDLSGSSSFNKSVQYRLMTSGIKICYTQAFQQVGNVISDYIKTYDYSAYHTAAKKLVDAAPATKLHPPLMEDYDALMQHIPRCKYHVKVHNFTLECHAKMEPETAAAVAQAKTARKLSAYIKPQIPYFCLHLKAAQLELVTPLKPDILVHTTCQLPQKPAQLLNACNESYSFELQHLELLLCEHMGKSQTQLLHVPALKANYGSLLKPHLWAKDEIPLQKAVLNCDSIQVKCSKRQLLLMQTLINCLFNYEPQLLCRSYKFVTTKPDIDAVKLVTQFLKLKITFKSFHSYTLINVALDKLQMDVCQAQAKHKLFHSLSNNNCCAEQRSWLECFVQLPNKKLNATEPTILLLWLDQYQIEMDQNFLKFLLYQAPKADLEREVSVEPEQIAQQQQQQQFPSMQSNYTNYTSQQSTSQRRRLNSRKLSHPEETVHYSSERDERFDIDNNSNAPVDNEPKIANDKNLWEFMHKIVLQMDVANGNLCLATNLRRNPQQKIISNYTQLILPKIAIHSSSIEYQKREEMPRKLHVQLGEKQISWVIKLSDLALLNFANETKYELLANAQTTITAALLLRSERAKPKSAQTKQEHDIENLRNRVSAKKVHLPVQKSNAMQTEHLCDCDNADSSSLCGEVESDTDLSANESVASLGLKKLETTKSEQNAMCINLHADTPPIHMLINAKRLQMIYEHFSILSKVLELCKSTTTALPVAQATVQPIQIVTPTEINASLKEFMDMDSNSEISLRTDNVAAAGEDVCYFCQWTMAKVAISLEDFCLCASVKCKVVLELEDLLATIDQHDTYTKCTAKMGHFNLGYYERNGAEEWKAREYLQIKVLNEISSSPFLNVIMTTAALRDYYKRVGIKRNGDLKQNITEIIIDMMALEITMDLDKLADLMNSLCTVISYDNNKTYIEQQATVKTSAPMTAQNMPMLHFNSRGLTLYIPLRNAQKPCTVLIWKIERIRVTPNLENPLQRNPVRTDVFYKAAQMGILGLPGSSVEDRQYELTMQHISAATGNWQEILTHLRSQDKDFLRSNPAFEWNNQNRRTELQLNDIFTKFTLSIILAPFITYNNVLICGQAMEFNCTNDFVANINMQQLKLITAIINRLQCIRKCPIKQQATVSEKSISTIGSANSLKHSAFSISKSSRDELMGAVSENNTTMYTALSNTTCDVCSMKSIIVTDSISRICSCADTSFTDVSSQNNRLSKRCSSTATMLDLRNSSTTVLTHARNTKLHLTMSENCTDSNSALKTVDSLLRSTLQRCTSGQFDAIDEDVEMKNKPDSGFQSMQNIEIKQKRSNTTMQQHSQQQINDNATNQELPQTISFVAGVFLIKIFDNKTVEATADNNLLLPFFSIEISQPSFMLTQNIKDLLIQISLFDFQICTADTAQPAAQAKVMFPQKLFDTRQAKLTASGIPPPLLNLKIQSSSTQLKEVDFELCKHMFISLNEQRIVKFINNLMLIYGTILEQPCFNVRAETAVVRASKIKLLRLKFFDADRINFKCSSLTFNFVDRQSSCCKFVLTETRAHVKFLMRPEKAVFSMSFGSFYLQTDQKIFLHPLSMRLAVDMISEPWYKLPLMNVNLNINAVQLDLGIYSMVRLKRMMLQLQDINNAANKKWQDFLKNRLASKIHRIPKNKLQAHKCPSLNSIDMRKHDKVKQREEYYQDDLRAGAFQFVELNTDTFLPLPYQIQIIKKNYGIICWRYPQPRKMSKIIIYPVLMHSSHPIQIKCVMEYFSDVHESFLPYCHFELSDTCMKEVNLPERSISANIWRVVILQSLVTVNGACFDTSEEEEELNTLPANNADASESDYVLHPKVLVACMRVETSFQSNCVPKCQLLINCNMLQVKLLNQPDEAGVLPLALSKYQLAQTTTISQAFLSLQAQNISVHGNFYAEQNFEFESKLNLAVHCLDQSYLMMLPLLENTNMYMWLHINQTSRQADLNLIFDKLHFHIGATIVQTLYAAKIHWEQQLNAESGQIMLPKCIVVNKTYTQLIFGQTDTTQRIALGAKQCHFYAFLSTAHKQELTFYILNNETQKLETSRSVRISLKLSVQNELYPVIIGQHCLFIECTRLSATQICISIKGQIELVSMVDHDLRVEFRNECNKNDEKTVMEHLIEKREHCSFYQYVQNNTNIYMRLKFGIRGKGRTGDIPLKTNKNLPWLVKVPTQNNEFISIWVRVLRENITEINNAKFQAQRILITIWPIFQINSLLTNPIKIKESTTEVIYDIAANGESTQLDLPATHLTEHQILFDYGFPVDKRTTKNYVLTLKSLNWNRFFWYDEEIWTVEHALQQLIQITPNSWPLKDEEELRTKRVSNNQNSTHARHIEYSIAPSRDFSCSLALTLSAWGLFINDSGINLSIFNILSKERVNVAANCIEMLGIIEAGFTINLPDEDTEVASQPIYLADQVPNSGRQYQVLSENFSIDILLRRKSEIFTFVLKLNIENQQKVLKLSSRVIIVNFTKNNLYILPLAMDHKERSSKKQVLCLNETLKSIKVPPVDSTINAIGRTIDGFFDLKQPRERSNDTAFAFFVCIKTAIESDVSIPLTLALPFTRRCFSIQNGRDSIPLAATLIEKCGVYYISILENKSPSILLHNQTDMPFFIGQTDTPEHAKVTKIVAEYEGRNFEWYQMLPSHSICYYSPFMMHSHFPDVDSRLCNLTLAVYTDKPCKKTLKWSKALSINKSFEKFLHIPKHGDVKVTVCDNHRIIRMSIYYIAQQMEFSVKDLRSRLLMPAPPACETDVNDLADGSFKSLETIDSSIDYKSQTAIKCVHYSDECENKLEWNINCYIQKTVCSVFSDDRYKDFFKTDTLAFYIDDFIMHYEDNDDKRELKLNLMNMQIDNQLFANGLYDFPVVFCPQQLYLQQNNLPQVQLVQHYCQQLLTNHTALATFTCRLYDDEYALKELVCRLSPIRIYIEDGYLNALLDNLLECVPVNCVYQAESDKTKLPLSPGHTLLPRDITAQVMVIAQPLQLHQLRIEPLQVLLSVHTSLRLYIALDHSPLSFGAYERQQLLTVPLRLGQSLGMHYLSGAIFGAGWVVGSLEILGSPSGLARSVTTGLKDFVSMPMQGLFHGPWDFVMGFTQGSASLLRNITAGTVNSVTKLAASVARNLDRLTLDQEHIERTEALRRCRPQGFAEGFSQGITGLGISILGAVGGIAHHTLEAHTPVQVVTGMGKGLMGALTKPISGAAELVALAGQGMLHAVGFNVMPAQRAPKLYHNQNMAFSAYRIWSLLPNVLLSDQILFHHDVMLVIKEQMCPGYIFLTSAVLALMEANTDKLDFVLPINKVDISADRENNTLFYVHLIKEKQEIEEDINYTNQRIMNFLHTSNNKLITADSLQDLLQLSNSEETERKNMDWAFYISAHLGQHIIEYLKVMKRKF